VGFDISTEVATEQIAVFIMILVKNEEKKAIGYKRL